MTQNRKSQAKLDKKDLKEKWAKGDNFISSEDYNFITGAFFAVGLVFVFLWVYFSSGKVIFEESVELKNLNDTIPYKTSLWKLDARVNVYQIELDVTFPTTINYELYADAEIYQEKKGQVNNISANLYYASGYDDGEYWTERETKTNKYFRNSESGNFYAELYAEPDTISSINKGVFLEDKANKLYFRVKTGDGLKSSRFGWMALIFFGLGILMSIKYFPSNT